ncbi:MAG: hypothetical protein JNJ77_16605 [Planctomycetia bacterium]|nr:hypothetical protein [Planctomycetia bacterium]
MPRKNRDKEQEKELCFSQQLDEMSSREEEKFISQQKKYLRKRIKEKEAEITHNLQELQALTDKILQTDEALQQFALTFLEQRASRYGFRRRGQTWYHISSVPRIAPSLIDRLIIQ